MGSNPRNSHWLRVVRGFHRQERATFDLGHTQIRTLVGNDALFELVVLSLFGAVSASRGLSERNTREMIKLLVSLFAGGVLTSLAEYHFKYSLIGTLYGLFTKTKTVIKADVIAVEKKL